LVIDEAAFSKQEGWKVIHFMPHCSEKKRPEQRKW